MATRASPSAKAHAAQRSGPTVDTGAARAARDGVDGVGTAPPPAPSSSWGGAHPALGGPPSLASGLASIVSPFPATLFNDARAPDGSSDTSPFRFVLRLHGSLFLRFCAAARVDPDAVLRGHTGTGTTGTGPGPLPALLEFLAARVGAEVLLFDGAQPFLYAEDFPHKTPCPSPALSVLNVARAAGAAGLAGGASTGGAATAAAAAAAARKGGRRDVGGISATLALSNSPSSSAPPADPGAVDVTLTVERAFPISSAHGGSPFRLALALVVPEGRVPSPSSSSAAAATTVVASPRGGESAAAGGRYPLRRDTSASTGLPPAPTSSSSSSSSPSRSSAPVEVLFVFSTPFKVQRKQPAPNATPRGGPHPVPFQPLPRGRETLLRAVLAAGELARPSLELITNGSLTVAVGGAAPPPPPSSSSSSSSSSAPPRPSLAPSHHLVAATVRTVQAVPAGPRPNVVGLLRPGMTAPAAPPRHAVRGGGRRAAAEKGSPPASEDTAEANSLRLRSTATLRGTAVLPAVRAWGTKTLGCRARSGTSA
jgi:hypothetical protein